MTAFFDRTQSIMKWCAERRMPPAESCEILFQRFLQVQEYTLWVSQKKKRSFTPRLSTYIMELATFLNVSTENRDFWQVGLAVFEAIRKYEADELYEISSHEHGRVWYNLAMMFDGLHDFCHRLTEFGVSDSPDRVIKGKLTVRNSDKWLNERYPDAPKW